MATFLKLGMGVALVLLVQDIGHGIGLKPEPVPKNAGNQLSFQQAIFVLESFAIGGTMWYRRGLKSDASLPSSSDFKKRYLPSVIV